MYKVNCIDVVLLQGQILTVCLYFQDLKNRHNEWIVRSFASLKTHQVFYSSIKFVTCDVFIYLSNTRILIDDIILID